MSISMNQYNENGGPAITKVMKRLQRIVPFFDDGASNELTRNRQNRLYANVTKLNSLISGPVNRQDLITPYKFER